MNQFKLPHPIHCCVGLLVISIGNTALAQVAPEISLKALQAPADVSVTLWASEPMVNNPTAMEIDSRGRVWIAEGKNYRMKMREFEDLKRVDGADRIRILEDSDGDGQADTVTDFASDIFPVPLGLAIEELWDGTVQTGTRVYIGNSPDLLVLEDTDGDDMADRRYQLLTGFRGVDSDHGLHGMSFGPDGRLYFTVGDGRYGADQVQAREATFAVTDKSGRRLSANNFGTTLRVNRDGTQLEVLSSGHRNNYEAAVDSFGNVFGSDNDDDGNRGCRLYWVLNGGAYGYQHPHSSRHWAEELPGIIPKLVGTGNGAPGGLLVYEGGALPERYAGTVLQIDSGTHQLNVFPLSRHGAGFRAEYRVLLGSSDDWFRPVDVAVAPDGSVYVCDWYDAGVGGNRFSDQTTGRIYCLRGERTTDTPPFDPGQPLAGLQSPNAVTRLASRDLLVAGGDSFRGDLRSLLKTATPEVRGRALHVLFALPETGHGDALAALEDPDARIRELALRLLTDDSAPHWLVEPTNALSLKVPAIELLQSILPLADDQDAGVRRALMMALRRVPTELINSELRQLITSWDGRDRYYLEAARAVLVERDSAFIASIFSELADEALEAGWGATPIALPPYYPIGSNDAYLKIGDELPPANSASRLAGLAWVLSSADALPALEKILSQNDSPYVEQAALLALSRIAHPSAGEMMLERFLSPNATPDNRSSMLQVLTGKIKGDWQSLRQQPALAKALRVALSDEQLAAASLDLIGRAGLKEYADELLKLAIDERVDQSTRAAALVGLARFRYAPVQAVATKLLQADDDNLSGTTVQLAALEALGVLSGSNELARYVSDPDVPLAIRRRAMQLIAETSAGASLLLQELKSGTLSEELSGELMFLLRNHSDRQMQRLAVSELPTSPTAEKVFDPGLLTLIQGKAERGRELFEKHSDAACARCHRTTDEGNLVGPDLASIGMKYGPSELLYHIQYPSAAINYNFVSSVFLMADGRVLNGLVLDRDVNQIQLGLATGQRITIDAEEVEMERPQTTSLMPEGLLANFTDQQVADLIEYLITLRQGDIGTTLAK